jgi:hypothetical protein
VLEYLNSTSNEDVLTAWFDSVFATVIVVVDEEVGEWVTDPIPRVLAPA